jgi:putative transposase
MSSTALVVNTLPRRVSVTEKERNRLVRFGSKLGKVLGELVTLVHPDTLRRWIREAGKRAKRRPAKVNRPRTQEETRELTIMLVRNNDGWGYTRIMGKMKKLVIELLAGF